MVVLGHRLLTGITYQGGHPSRLDAPDYVSWGRWVTLLFQVMPVFFLVGGYANAVSWTAHQQPGEGWTEWIRGRALRLLWPAAVYVAVILPSVAVARAAGANTAELAHGGWLAGNAPGVLRPLADRRQRRGVGSNPVLPFSFRTDGTSPTQPQ